MAKVYLPWCPCYKCTKWYLVRRFDNIANSTHTHQFFEVPSPSAPDASGDYGIDAIAPIPSGGAIVSGRFPISGNPSAIERHARIDDAGNILWTFLKPFGRQNDVVIRATDTEFVTARTSGPYYQPYTSFDERLQWRSVSNGSLISECPIGPESSWTQVTDITANANLDCLVCVAYRYNDTGLGETARCQVHRIENGRTTWGGSATMVFANALNWFFDPSTMVLGYLPGSFAQALHAVELDDGTIAASGHAVRYPPQGPPQAYYTHTSVGLDTVVNVFQPRFEVASPWYDVDGWGTGYSGKILSGDGTQDTLCVRTKGYGKPDYPDYLWGSTVDNNDPSYVLSPTGKLELDFCADKAGGAFQAGLLNASGGTSAPRVITRQGPSGVVWHSVWPHSGNPDAMCRAVNVDDSGRLWAAGEATK